MGLLQLLLSSLLLGASALDLFTPVPKAATFFSPASNTSSCLLYGSAFTPSLSGAPPSCSPRELPEVHTRAASEEMEEMALSSLLFCAAPAPLR